MQESSLTDYKSAPNYQIITQIPFAFLIDLEEFSSERIYYLVEAAVDQETFMIELEWFLDCVEEYLLITESTMKNMNLSLGLNVFEDFEINISLLPQDIKERYKQLIPTENYYSIVFLN